MLELYQVGLIAIALLLVVIAIAARGWARKTKSQTVTLDQPEFSDFVDEGNGGWYVATTFAGRPLDRVTGHGLGYAGKARVLIGEGGVQISRNGEKSFFIRESTLKNISRTSTVIDKAVESDGLLSLRWKLGETEVETHLRFSRSQDRDSVAVGVSEMLRSAR
jgi:hypothetical protein